jgi:hypothetical protein
VVGYYADNNGYHGFGYTGGSYTAINDPLSQNSNNAYDTYAIGTNNTGNVVGFYIDATGGHGSEHGFIYDGSSYITLNYPNPIGGIYNGTHAVGINNQGQVAGWYNDDIGNHGFVYSGGIYTPINDPNTPSGSGSGGSGGTIITGINDSGQVTGYYTYGATTYGFLYSGGNYFRFIRSWDHASWY